MHYEKFVLYRAVLWVGHLMAILSVQQVVQNICERALKRQVFIYERELIVLPVLKICCNGNEINFTLSIYIVIFALTTYTTPR